MVPQRKNRGLFPREERDIQSRQNETIGHSQDNYLKFYLSPETILLVPYLPLPTQNSSLLLLYPKQAVTPSCLFLEHAILFYVPAFAHVISYIKNTCQISIHLSRYIFQLFIAM